MATHNLKTLSAFFWEVAAGRKTAELRRDDRGFAVGDVLLLDEITPDGQITGAFVAAEITHIVRDSDGSWLAPGHCMLSLRVLTAPRRARPANPMPRLPLPHDG